MSKEQYNYEKRGFTYSVETECPYCEKKSVYFKIEDCSILKSEKDSLIVYECSRCYKKWVEEI